MPWRAARAPSPPVRGSRQSPLGGPRAPTPRLETMPPPAHRPGRAFRARIETHRHRSQIDRPTPRSLPEPRAVAVRAYGESGPSMRLSSRAVHPLKVFGAEPSLSHGENPDASSVPSATRRSAAAKRGKATPMPACHRNSVRGHSLPPSFDNTAPSGTDCRESTRKPQLCPRDHAGRRSTIPETGHRPIPRNNWQLKGLVGNIPIPVRAEETHHHDILRDTAWP